MLAFIINYSGAMIATPEHRMCPHVELIFPNYIISNKEKLVRACDNPNIYLGNILEPMHGVMHCEFIKK